MRGSGQINPIKTSFEKDQMYIFDLFLDLLSCDSCLAAHPQSLARRRNHKVDLGPHEAHLRLKAPGHQDAVPQSTVDCGVSD